MSGVLTGRGKGNPNFIASISPSTHRLKYVVPNAITAGGAIELNIPGLLSDRLLLKDITVSYLREPNSPMNFRLDLFSTDAVTDSDLNTDKYLGSREFDFTRYSDVSKSSDIGNKQKVYVCLGVSDSIGAGKSGIVIVDVSTPSSPLQVGSLFSEGSPYYLDGAYGVYVKGNYAYVAAYYDNALTILDISDPSKPKFVSSIQGAGAPNWLGGPNDVRVVGDYAYIASFDDSALTIVDVSTPNTPVVVGSVQGMNSPNKVSIRGNYAYIADIDDGALYVIDISDVTAPSIIGSLVGGATIQPYLDEAADVNVSGSVAYVVSQNGNNALVAVDVSDPTNPAFSGVIRNIPSSLKVIPYLGQAVAVKVKGDYAYVCGYASNAIVIIDISDPTNLIYQGSVRSGPSNNFALELPDYLDVYGNHCYVFGTNVDLAVINVENAISPYYVTSLTFSDYSSISGFVYQSQINYHLTEPLNIPYVDTDLSKEIHALLRNLSQSDLGENNLSVEIVYELAQ